MLTDTLLKEEGMRILAEKLGRAEASRFIALMLREPFDYTAWRENLCEGRSVEEISRDAMEYCRTHGITK